MAERSLKDIIKNHIPIDKFSDVVYFFAEPYHIVMQRKNTVYFLVGTISSQ